MLNRNDEIVNYCSLRFALSNAKATDHRFADVEHSACMAQMLLHNTSLKYILIMTCACSAFAVLSSHHPVAAIGLSAWVQRQLFLQQPDPAAWPSLPELLECLNTHTIAWVKHCTNAQHSDAFSNCMPRACNPCIDGRIVPHTLCTLLTVHI